jgi:hypothetical protein
MSALTGTVTAPAILATAATPGLRGILRELSTAVTAGAAVAASP